VCSLSRERDKSIDRIIVYVDDLLMTSDSTSVLQQLDAQLRAKYGGVTTKIGTVHDYLGIKWDFGVPGEVSMSMEGYINDIFKSYNVLKKFPNPANEKLFVITTYSPSCRRIKESIIIQLL
jgi:hypothetical protein